MKRLMKPLHTKIAYYKSKLPKNGDWLWVSFDADAKRANLSNVADTIKKIRTDDRGILGLMYDRSKNFESRINSNAADVRDKGKSLLAMSSFAATAIFTLTTVLSSIIRLQLGAVAIPVVVIYALLCAHLLRALYKALEVVKREEVIYASHEDILGAYGDEKVALRRAIAETIVFAQRTRRKASVKADHLLVGLEAFKYSIIYFFLLVGINGIMVLFFKSPDEQADVKVAMLTNTVDSIAAHQYLTTFATQQLSSRIGDLEDELFRIQKSLDSNRNLIEQSQQGIDSTPMPSTR